MIQFTPIDSILYSTRAKLPAFIDVDCYRAAEFDGYMFRFYNIKNHQLFTVAVSQMSILTGDYTDVLQNALITVNSRWNSKLHRAMR